MRRQTYINTHDIHENSKVGEMFTLTDSVGEVGIYECTAKGGPFPIHRSVMAQNSGSI